MHFKSWKSDKKKFKKNEKINSLNKEKNGLIEQFRNIEQLNEAMNNYLVRKKVVKVIRGENKIITLILMTKKQIIKKNLEYYD